MSFTITQAASAEDFESFGALIADYVEWCRARYSDDKWFVDQTLSHQSLDSELQDLAKKYTPPTGRAFIAREEGRPCGCAAYRWRGEGVVEMKRLFVPPAFKGKGYGRKICDALIASARADGCTTMLLDTANLMREAIALYESVGFRRCAPYNDYPPELMRYLIFMELPLRAAG